MSSGLHLPLVRRGSSLESIKDMTTRSIQHPMTPRFVSQGSIAELIDKEVSRKEADTSDESWLTYWHDLSAWKLVVSRSIPNILGTACFMINETINVIGVGHAPNTSPAALAAVGLGNMMQNVFGLSIVLGIQYDIYVF